MSSRLLAKRVLVASAFHSFSHACNLLLHASSSASPIDPQATRIIEGLRLVILGLGLILKESPSSFHPIHQLWIIQDQSPLANPFT